MKNFKSRSVAAVISAALAINFSGIALADSTDDIVNALIAKGVLTEEEGFLLLKGRAAEKEIQKKAGSTVTVGKKGLVVKSNDGQYSAKVGGRIHIEAMSHRGDEGLTTQATDGANVRRSRIYLKGHAKEIEYILEADLAGNSLRMKDVFVVYTGIGNWDLTVGNQKHAMTMEVQESSNDIMFTERGMTYALSAPYFDRALGVNAKVKGETWNVQGGIYGDHYSNITGLEEGHGYAIRGTVTPVWNKKEGQMVHIGASYGVRSLDEIHPRFTYETTNDSNLNLLETPNTAGFDKVKLAAIEFAAMNGPLSFQAEYHRANVEGTNDYDFDAWYATVGYTLTGESRSYKPTDGEFKRLKPKNDFSFKNGGWGAWEVAARLDSLDLNDGNGAAAITGGEGNRYTLALNWYLNYNCRLMADYSKIYDINNGPVKTKAGGEADDVDTLTVRAQWAF
ncbi:MAG: porin [Methylophilaceae bacterium]